MILGIDTGGTKTLLALFSDSGEILRQFKYPTPQNYNEYILQLIHHVKNDFADITAISIALPSPVEHNRPLRFANLAWQGVDPAKDLTEALGVPVLVENDVSLACISECKDTAGLCLYIAIGTGIGSGLAFDGHLVPELASSFNIGHIVLNYGGEPREWESFASGKVLTEHFGKKVENGLTESEWAEVAARISCGLLAVCPIFKPLTIIFGGGVGAHFDYFKPALEPILTTHLKPYYRPKMRLSRRPNEATLYGSYDYAKDQLK
ncbi:MAG: ROK family protein [Candidatus Nomurabacteria bacterium]|jgi:polyphosphate glucokinase|nr:ROK family protein [Candidatus Nomurabacteria bacterium]